DRRRSPGRASVSPPGAGAGRPAPLPERGHGTGGCRCWTEPRLPCWTVRPHNCSEPAWRLPGSRARWPEGVTRHDLGVQQLRDVTMPLQLWQALAPDLPPTPTRCSRSTLALSSALVDGRRSVVDWGEAIAVSTLQGRESELGTLQRWVVDERCRLV